MFEMACEMGGIIAHGSREQCELLRQFAYGLGMAFQIRDDLLDIAESESVSGKTFGSDIIERKKTYLSVSFLQEARTEDKEKLMSIWKSKTIGQKEIEAVRLLFEKNGILQKAENAILHHVSGSLAHLDGFPDSEEKRLLVGIAEAVGK
jgi:geranylgeranyl pyrophosphate synthase